jgi:acyl-CoA synthetase (NDP forming)
MSTSTAVGDALTLDARTRVGHLLAPTGIAIVGASDTRYYARSLITNLINAGYPADQIFPVNPRYETVVGLPCYPSLTEIGRPFSLVVAATGRDTAPAIVADAGAAGAETVVVLADGFAEQDDEGRALQQQLGELSDRSGVKVLGPNTLGYFAPASGAAVWAPGILEDQLKDGGIGIVFQSSGMLNLFVNLCMTRRLGVRAAFSVGNELGVSTADLIGYLAEDPNTKVIVTMVETTDSPRDLVEALETARAAGKPVVMLKLGRSERAQRNAIAHTGRMASAATSWNAVLDRLGVVVVHDLDELVECAALFERAVDSVSADAPGRTALVTVSGGDCSLLADLSDELEVPLAELQPGTHSELVRMLDKPKLVGNPLDVENLQRSDEEQFYRIIDTLCADPGVDIVAYRMYLPTTPNPKIRDLYERLIARAREAGKTPVVLTRAVEDLDREWYRFFDSLDTAYLPAYRPALTALSRLGSWAQRVAPVGPLSLSAIPVSTQAGAEGHVAGWDETQAALAAAGVTYGAARLATDAAGAASAAKELGFPVAVKLFSREAPHKSDIGGVFLGVGTPEDVESAAREIAVNAASAGVAVEGFEIQAMASRGVEMLVGVTRDPTLGPIVMVGMGGTLTEITHDVVLMLPETDEADVLRHLKKLAGYPLLDGYRGAAAADVAALASMVASLSRYLVSDESHSLAELDLNPVMVLPVGKGVVAVDAVLVVD